MEKKSREARDLSSTTIKAGQRVYFVDAKVDSLGSRFVAISELKSKSKSQQGGRERHRIHIYEEDMPRFLDALGEALTAMSQERKSKHEFRAEESYSMEALSSDLAPTSVDIPDLGDIVDLE